MPSLQELNIIVAILAACAYQLTRQRLAWLISGPFDNVFDIRPGNRLEPMERKFPLRQLLSPSTRWWYLLNRLSLIIGAYFFCWGARFLWFSR